MSHVIEPAVSTLADWHKKRFGTENVKARGRWFHRVMALMAIIDQEAPVTAIDTERKMLLTILASFCEALMRRAANTRLIERS